MGQREGAGLFQAPDAGWPATRRVLAQAAPGTSHRDPRFVLLEVTHENTQCVSSIPLKAPFQFLSAQTLENVGKDWEDTGGGGRERAPSAAVSAGAFRAMSGRRRTPGPLAGGTSGSEAQAQKGGGSERGGPRPPPGQREEHTDCLDCMRIAAAACSCRKDAVTCKAQRLVVDPVQGASDLRLRSSRSI